MLASICACVKLPEPVVTVMLPVVPAVELVNPRTTPALAPLLDFTKLEAETFGDSVPDIEAALISITKLAAAEAEVQKNQAKTQAEAQLEQTKNQLSIQYLQQEAQVKKELMAYEFELNSKLKGMEREVAGKMEQVREDRKDQRVDRQASHQKEMINQRKQGDSVNKFESSGNDIITGGVDLDKFIS